MKPRKTVSVYVLLVGVLGLLIVGGAFAFQVISEATKNQLPAAQRELVKPLDGKIEQTIIDNLSKRQVISRDEISRVSLAPATLEITPEASPSSVSAVPTTKIK